MDKSGGIQASLSGRYATALFELARDNGSRDNGSIDKVESSLSTVKQALAESRDFASLASSPLIARGDATRGVTAVANVLKLDSLTANFLGVLAQNRRLREVPAIVRAFRTLAANHRGEMTAEIVSAHPLSNDQVEALKTQLRQRVGRDVAVDLSVDPSLLGGLVVKIGSQMIDSSIKTRLNSLAHAMKG